MGERIAKAKVRKLIGRGKESSIGKAKASCVSKVKELIHYFPLAGRCLDISRKAGLYHT